MADFLTRLSERTLGMAPVVQPLITSVFAPELGDHLPGLGYEGEAPASSGDLYRAKSPQAVETLPARETRKKVSQDLAMSEREAHNTNAHITSPHPSGTSDVSPEPYHPVRSGTSEHRITPAQEGQPEDATKPPRRMPDAVGPDLPEANTVSGREDQRNLASAVPGAFPRTPESRPRPSHPGESDSWDHKIMTVKEDQRHPSRVTARNPQTPPEMRPRTEAGSTPSAWDSPEAQPEDATMTQKQEEQSNVAPTMPGRSQTIPEKPELLHPDRTLLDPVQGATPPPGPSLDTQTVLDAHEGTTESKFIPDRPAASDAPPVASRMVRPRLNPHVERGPQEPRVDAPESSAPTIRVTIGRIEVRAITPPPRPLVEQTVPPRLAPTLSLDDYLKQRNGEQR